MNCAAELQITVTEGVPERAVCRRHEPIRRQNHDENSDRANDAAYDDHAIRRDALGEGPDCRSEKNDDDRIDAAQFPDWRIQSHLAIAEFREDVIHLQENRFQESDEEKEHQ